MKLQRTPLILLTTALLLGGGVWLYETQKVSKPDAGTPRSQKLFGFEESEVRSLTLTTPTKNFAFSKQAVRATPSPATTGQSSPAATKPPVWRMTAPRVTPASDAAVAYLLNLMATGTAQETLKVPATKKAEFGLEPPAATAEVKLFNQRSHRIVLGKPNFNRSGLYAQIDSSDEVSGDLTVTLVAIDFENAVNRPLAEWIDKNSASNATSPAKEDQTQPESTPAETPPESSD